MKNLEPLNFMGFKGLKTYGLGMYTFSAYMVKTFEAFRAPEAFSVLTLKGLGFRFKCLNRTPLWFKLYGLINLEDP